MAVSYVNRAYLIIDGREIDCESIDYTLSQEGLETIKTMNRRNRAKGFQGGVISAELSITVPIIKGGIAVNFNEMMLNESLFTAFVEYDDGAVATFRDCRVSQVKASQKHGEKHTHEITAMSLDPAFDN